MIKPLDGRVLRWSNSSDQFWSVDSDDWIRSSLSKGLKCRQNRLTLTDKLTKVFDMAMGKGKPAPRKKASKKAAKKAVKRTYKK